MRRLIPEFAKAPIRRYLHSKAALRSQAGQDFWVVGEVFNELRGGYFLDIGAHDGIQLSNTYILEKKYGWTGICIEANPAIFERLIRHRRARCINACLDSGDGIVQFAKSEFFGGIVSAETDNHPVSARGDVVALRTVALATILQEQGAPSEIDYLSIDVEGAEERVLGSFPFEKYRFKCMTVERPTPALRDLFRRSGYVLVKEIPGLDCFYVRADFLDQYRANTFSFYRKKWLIFGFG